jgi:hypothetical protein
MEASVFDTPEFKREFWLWFDALPTSEKRKFQNFPADMAELYFYNKIYSQKLKDNNLYVK